MSIGRFDECGSDVQAVIEECVDLHFGELKQANIKALFNTKKREKTGGRIILATIQKTTDIIKYLTADEAKAFNGFDYILLVDIKAWELASPKDRERLIRHELRHCYVDYKDLESGDTIILYKIIDHDVQDFMAEIELNADDARWAEKLCTLVRDVYEQEKEQGKSKGLARRAGR